MEDCSEAVATALAACARADGPGRAGAGPDGVVGARLDVFLQVGGNERERAKGKGRAEERKRAKDEWGVRDGRERGRGRSAPYLREGERERERE